ncbi:MAG: hypothetical protein M1838_001445 [Thelocarpon superellum]|nr:MAG: hypothetical protein M1838_001445 [Thelocarpon superellum]
MSVVTTLRPAQSVGLPPFLSSQTCPNCGAGLPHSSHAHDDGDAQRRIAELESQVKILTGKATSAGESSRVAMDIDTLVRAIAPTLAWLTRSRALAADRLADYEDEIRRLKCVEDASPHPAPPASRNQSLTPEPSAAGTPAVGASGSPDGASAARAASIPVQTRLSSFLTSRKSPVPMPVPVPAPATSPSPATQTTPSTSELEAALNREHLLRQQAEGKLTQANGELEELSTALFAQANEMVASERKARAKLEERVAVLERRDGEKRKRLERLEGAVQRIERVRGLLSVPR